jgi:titin
MSSSSSPYLLLIDSRVSDIPNIVGSLLPGVDHLVVNYAEDTYASLQSKITQSYTCVGVAQHNAYDRVYSFLESEVNMGLSYLVPGPEPDTYVERTLEQMDPDLTSWSAFAGFLTWLKTERGMVNFDLLACDLLADANWVYALQRMQALHGVHIRASLNITGEGGDFILESDNVNLIGVCFSEAILQYKYSFDQNGGPTMMFDTNGAVWMCGKNNLGQMGLGSTASQITLVNINPQPGKTIKAVGNGSNNTVLMSFTDGSLYASGSFGGMNFLLNNAAVSDSNVFVVCDKFATQLPGKVVQKAMSNSNTCLTILTTDGCIYSAGTNSTGMFGTTAVAVNATGTAGQLYQMTNNTGKTIVDFQGTLTSTIVLMSDGTVYATGTYDTLGVGGTGYYTTLTQITFPGGETIKQIASSNNGVAVLTTDGKVYVTGNNGAYLYCNGTNISNYAWNLIPLPAGKTAAGVSAGSGNVAILFTDGTLYGAGDNSVGQLGMGTATRAGTNSMGQVPIPSNKFVVHMQCYGASMIVLTADGYVYGTGANGGNGQAGLLGTNDTLTKKTLTQMMKTVGGVVSNMTSIGRLNNAWDPIPGVLSATAPGAPTLGAVTAGNGQLSVAFSPPASDGGAAVTTYKYSLNGGSYVDAATTSSPLVITGLANGTSYTVTLKATNSVGDGTASSTSAAVTPDIAPAAPTLGTVTAGNQQLSVAFTAPASNGGSAITGYKYSLNGGAFVNAATTESPMVISGLTNGTSYTVALKAINTLDGAASATSAACIPDVLPNSPTVTSIVPGNKQLSVYFTAPVDNGSSAYTCKYSVNGGALVTFDKTVSPLVISGLTNGTAYTVALVSVNQLGTSTPESSATGTPAPSVPSAVVINSVQVLAATTAGVYGKVAIAFTAPASNDDGGITGYNLSINGAEATALGKITSPYITTVAPGATYQFVMTATNAVGTSASSNTATLTPVFVPENPTIERVDASSGSIAITFTAGNNGGSSVTAYKYSINNGSTFVSTSNLTSPLVVSGIANGTVCSVILRAVNATGESGYSNMVQATPVSVPDAPSIAVVAGIKQVTIAVTPGSNQGAAVTKYAYSLNGGSTFVDVAPAVSPIVVSELASDVEVSVCVKATNSVGDSAVSNTVAATPFDVPSVPTDVSATAGDQQVSISFVAGASNGSPITDYEYSLDGGATYTAVAVASFSSPYVITGLTNGTVLSIRLRAVNAAGASASASATATPFGIPLNVRITGITLATGSASVYVACNANGRSVTTYYYSFDGVNYIDAATAASPIQLNYLQNGTSYTVSVKAENVAGVSTESQMVSFMPYTPQSVPGAPLVESVVAGDKQLAVSFVDGSNNGSPIVGYKYTVDGTTYVWASETSSPLLIDGLTNGQSYAVAVKAVNGTGDSAVSNSVVGTPVGAPGTPTILSTTTNAAALSVTYSVPLLNGNAASDIQVQYRLTTVADGTFTDSEVMPTNGTFTLSGIALSDGVKYELQLRVSVSAVEAPSAWSTAAVVYPPPTPVMSAYSQMDKSFSVTFSNEVDSTNVLGYKYKMDSADYQWMDYIPNPTYTFTGLVNRSHNRNPNKTYTLYFKTVNKKSEESAAIGPYIFSAYGPPDLPSVLSVTAGNTWIEVKALVGDDGSLTSPSFDFTTDEGATVHDLGALAPDASGVITMGLYPLENRTQYAFRIRARTGVGSSAWSPLYTATPMGRPWTQVIKGVTTNGTTALIAVDQLFNDRPDTTCFNRPDLFINGPGNVAAYQCSLDGGNTYSYLPNVVSPLLLHGLTAGNTYSVKVKVISTYQQESWPSNTYTFTVSSVPDALSVVSVNPGDQSLQVVVLPGNNGGSAITQYQYSLNGGNTFTQAADTVALSNGQIGITVPGLVNGTAYSISVRAVNANGNSVATPVLVSASPVGTPSAPTVTDVSFVAGVAYVSFTEGATNGAGDILNYKYTFDGGASYQFTAGNSSPLTITGLSYGNNYNLQLAAYTSKGVQGAMSAVHAFAGVSVPDTPLVTSIVAGDQSIAVVFVPGSSNGSAITGYEYSLDSGTTFAEIATSSVPGGKRSATIAGLTNGTSYTVQMRAVSAVGASAATLVSQSYVPSGTPAAPTVTDVVCQPGTALVHFTAGSVNGPGSVATYKFSLDGGATYKFAEGHVSPLVLRDLSDGVSYTVQVKAFTSTGLESAASNSLSFNTSSEPSAPAIASAVPDNQSILLTIVPGSSNGGAITHYQYSLNGSATFHDVSANNGGTSITVAGLTNGDSYTVALRAVNAVGASSWSLPSALVTPFSITAATQIVRIEPEHNALHVFVDNAALEGVLENNYAITGYQYALDGTTFAGEVTTGSATDFVIPGLTNGNVYTVAVKAITAAGVTGASNAVANAQPYTVPAAPTNVTVVPYSKKAVVSFEVGEANGSAITGFRYRINGAGEIYTALTTASPITVYGLENAEDYTVEVYAVNAAGLSSPSVSSATFTPFDVPFAPVVTEVLPGNGCAYVYFNPINANGSPVTALRYSLGAAAIDVSGISSPLTVPGLTNKSTYQIAILAVNAAGQSAASNTKAVVVGTPLAPVIESITRSPKSLIVNFSTPNDNGSPITGYMWAEKGTTKFNKFVSLASPQSCLGLTNGQGYDIVMYAVNKNGMSVASNSLGRKVPFDVPTKPVISGVIPQLGSAILSFTAPPNNGSPITKYQYALNADTVFTDLSGLTSPITITGLPNNVNYSIKMIAINAAGASLVSPSSKPVMYKYLPPAQIKVSSLVASFNKLTVGFTAPAANGAPITTYLYALNGSSTFVDANTATVPFDIVDGVQNNTNYNISVIAVNSAGQSVASAPLAKPVSFVWLPPLAPTITNVTTGDQSATVFFTAPATRGPAVSGYAYSFDNGATNVDLSGQLTSPFTITGLTNDTSYNLTLVAMSSAGYSVRSAARPFMPVYKAPAAPTIGTVLAQNTQLTVNFTAGAANGSPITGYKYTVDNGNTMVDAGTDKSPIVITGLVNGKTYSIRLVATNALGDSPLSVAKPAAPKA